jgi:hypothetical protein
VSDSPATPAPTGPSGPGEPGGPAASALPAAFVALVDDAAVFPPGNAPLEDALAAHTARRDQPWTDLVGTFVVKDTDLPRLRGTSVRLSLVCTGGAGQVAGPLGLARRLGLDVAGIEIALRDPDELAGNARRVVAAIDEVKADGDLDDLLVHVELPGPATHGWLAAADEVAAREDLGLRLKFRTGGLDADAFPTVDTLAAWIEAALDRETPFKCTAGLHRAVRHTDPATGFEHHGFLNVLAATRTALDAGDRDATAAVLAEQDADALLEALPDLDTLARTRRWFTSFGSCSVHEPLEDLAGLGLVGLAAGEHP